MFVRVRINGRTFFLSEDEFMKLVLGMTPANPVDVLDFVGGRNRGERQHCRSPLYISMGVTLLKEIRFLKPIEIKF